MRPAGRWARRRPAGRRRSTLATRIALLSVGIAVVTALVAGAIATGLIRNAGGNSAKQTLGRLADVAASVSTEARTGKPVLIRLQAALRGLHVQSGVVRPDGRLRTGTPWSVVP